MSRTPKTICAQGLHPTTADYGRRLKDGGWRCRPCGAAYQAIRRSKNGIDPNAARREQRAIQRAILDAGTCPDPCGVSLQTHPRCRDCSLLAFGPHLTQALFEGICGACWRHRQSVRRKRLERAS